MRNGRGCTYGSQSRVSDCSSLSASHRVTNAPHTGNASDKSKHTFRTSVVFQLQCTSTLTSFYFYQISIILIEALWLESIPHTNCIYNSEIKRNILLKHIVFLSIRFKWTVSTIEGRTNDKELYLQTQFNNEEIKQHPHLINLQLTSL